MENTGAVLILAHKLLNTMQSPSFQKSLTKLWVGAVQSDAIMTIQNKAAGGVSSKIATAKRHGDIHGAITYIEQLAAMIGVKVRKGDTKGLVNTVTPREYDDLRNFICDVSSKRMVIGELQQQQFQCHELLVAMAQYLVIKDSVENGTGISSLDAVIKTLLETKPVDFFRNGHPADIFVHDRIAMLNHPKACQILRCSKYWLSTYMLDDAKYQEADAANFELFKVA